MNKYYLVGDEGTGWYHAIIKTDEKGEKVIVQTEVNTIVEGTAFVSNILNRELHFSLKEFEGISLDLSPCYGWTISEFEYDRVLHLINLSHAVEEFNKLKKYE